jgi:hypothetical protein
LPRIRSTAVAGLLLAALSALDGQAVVVPWINNQFTDQNGNPLSGGFVYSCTASSSCPGTAATTYTNSSQTVANQNPIQLGSDGRPENSGSPVGIWLPPGVAFKFVCTNAVGLVIPGCGGDNLIGGGSGGSGNGWNVVGNNVLQSTTGSVGIGTSSPLQKLGIVGNEDLQGILLLRNGSAISQTIALSAPNGMAASYPIVLPPALPMATSCLEVSSAGVGSFTNCGSGAGSPGAPVHSIQFNNPLGTFAGDTNFTYLAGSPNQVTLAGVFQASGSTGGFDAPTNTAYNAIQAPMGGVLSLQFTMTEEAAPSVSAAASAVLYDDSTLHNVLLSVNGGAYAGLATTTGALTNGHCVSINSTGNFIDAGGACTTGGGGGTVSSCSSIYGVAYYAATGTTVSCSAGFLWEPSMNQVSLAGTFETVGTTYGFDATTCTAYNCIQAPLGGAYANLYSLLQISTPGLAASGNAAIYADTNGTSPYLHVSFNGGAYVGLAQTTGTLTPGDCIKVSASAPLTFVDNGSACGGGGGSGTVSPGTQYQVTYYTSTGTTVGGSAGFTWNPAANQVSVAGNVETIGTSYGFDATNGTLWNCVQVPSGGMTGKNFTATSYIQIGLSNGVPSPTSGDTQRAGTKFWNNSVTPLGSEQTYTGSCWFNTAGTEVDVVDSTCHKGVELIDQATVLNAIFVNQPAGSNNGVAISATGSAGGSVIVYNAAATAVDTLNSTGLTMSVSGPTPLTATNTGVGAGDGAATFFGEGSGTGVVGITAAGSAHNIFLNGGGGAGFVDITGNTLVPGSSCGSTYILVLSTNGHGYTCGQPGGVWIAAW